MARSIWSRDRDDEGALVRNSVATFALVIAMFMTLSGIAECASKCPVYDENGDQVFGPDGNPLAVNCVSCLESNPPPCKSDAWSLEEGVACDVSNQPDAPDGTTCDFSGTDDGVCTAGVCDGVRFACTEQGILDAIAAGGGPHYFDCAGPTTVNTSGYIDIDNDVVLDAEGNITLDGGGTHGLIIVPAGVTAELIGFTIQGAGGLGQVAFVSSGDVTLRDVNFFDNVPTNTGTGAVSNSGDLTVRGGVYSGNDTIPCGPTSCGSPFARDLVTWNGTANLYGLRGNHEFGLDVGHAQSFVDNDFVLVGELNIYDSVLNVTWFPLSVVNCTVIATGGIVAGAGTTEVVNSTIAGFILSQCTGGNCGATTTVRSSIVSFIDVPPPAGVVSEGFNIYGIDDGGVFNQPTDQQDNGLFSIFYPTTTRLGPLQDNGGPTQTFLPGPGSIAIDAIPAAECTLTTDQRGISRPQGAACDIGAVEVEQP